MPKKIIFHNPLSPGDVVVGSALIRDLHACYPGQFVTDYTGTTESYFRNAPYITKLPTNDPEAEKWRMSYSFIHKSNQSRMHFMYGYYHDFNERFGLDVKMQEFAPDIHFDKHELETPLVGGRYWVICSGGKRDFVTKWWDPKRWQQVVDMLKGRVQFVQVGGKNHFQPDLKGTLDLRGKTSFRELCRLILHSDGVCCVVTSLMHLAAACNRPCVVVAGGREAWWWEAYTRKNRDANMRSIHGDGWNPPKSDGMIDHIFFHSINKYNLDCCASGGCWKSKVGDGKAENQCKYVMRGPTILQPKCLMHVTPEQVANAVNFYEEQRYPDKHTFIPSFSERTHRTPIVDLMGSADKDMLDPPVTVCTLLYGPYIDLHQRVLQSVVQNTDPEMYKLRIGMNELCPETKEWLEKFKKKNNNVHMDFYDSAENIKKYPMMRRMFHDKENPIDTRWVVWLDDDSHIVEDDWLVRLSHSMRENYGRGYNMYGKRYFYEISNSHITWIKDAVWYSGKSFRVHTSKDKRTGRDKVRPKVDFATGGFWAIEASWLREWNWPDPRINHNGGDIMMGEAIRQTGGDVKNWDYGVNISDAKRRGYSEKVIGAK
jgi:ADP-heptose:LPS heptosyltransferase